MIPVQIASFLLGRGGAILAGVLVAGAVLAGTYQTGVNAERKRGEAVALRQTIATMKRQAEVSLDIQTRMAQRLAALRVAEQEQDGQVELLIAEIAKRPSTGACMLDDTRRLRLQSIRIGRPPSDQRRR